MVFESSEAVETTPCRLSEFCFSVSGLSNERKYCTILLAAPLIHDVEIWQYWFDVDRSLLSALSTYIPVPLKERLPTFCVAAKKSVHVCV